MQVINIININSTRLCQIDDLPEWVPALPLKPASRSLLVPLASDHSDLLNLQANPSKHGGRALRAATAPSQNEVTSRLECSGTANARPPERTNGELIPWCDRLQCAVWEPRRRILGSFRRRE